MTRITRRAVLACGATVAAGGAARNSLAAEPLHMFSASLQAADPPRPIPPISIVLPDGVRQSLSDYRDRGVVLNMWATWCAPCVAEMPALDRLSRAVGPDRIVVLPLSSDRKGAPAVDGFFLTHGIHDLPVLLDPSGAASRLVGARGIPTTILIDPRGFEVGRVEGAVDWADEATIASIRKLIGSSV